MTIALENLPDDVGALRAVILAMGAELAAERERNDRLCHFLRQLQRMQFGKRSEKLDPEVKRRQAAARRRSRGALPPHLPRLEIIIAPEATACPCCRGAMHVIG